MLWFGGGGLNLYDLFPALVHLPRDLLPRVQPPRLLLHHQAASPAALLAENKTNIKGDTLHSRQQGGIESL